MRFKFEKRVHIYESLDSTNLKARDFIQSGAPVGTTIVARTQTQGRGRMDRKWHSPSGGLYFSTLLIPSKPARASELSILAGAAVAQAIAQLLPKGIQVSLKWPNDVLLNGKKAAGILSESVGDETVGMCIVGIGVNLNTPANELETFAANAFPATSLSAELKNAQFDADQVLDLILTKLETLYARYWDRGFDAIRQVWHENCHMVGREVQVENAGFTGNNDQNKTIKGQFLGLDPNGAMVVELPNGQKVSFYSGEVTCFWQ